MATGRELESLANIKVIGVGGGGCNAINRMIQEHIQGVQFVAVNADAQALIRSQAPIRIRIGDRVTRGLGCGGDPEQGLRAAEESRDELLEVLQGADMVFITAGMGGGTGTGAAPVVAEIARQVGALTVAIVTKPFSFEGYQRTKVAEEGLARLREHVDTLIPISNDRLLQVCDKKVTVDSAFRLADDVLRQGIQSIADIITTPGEINRDFADVRSIMKDAGQALMAIGYGSGDNRALEAARQATSNTLLDIDSIEGARGVLFVIYHGPDLTIHELWEASETITKAAHQEARVLWGNVQDPALEGQVRITVIATGFGAREARVPVNGGHEGEKVRRFPSSLPPQPTPEDFYDMPPWLRRNLHAR
jgi:cell division protein FtsZ